MVGLSDRNGLIVLDREACLDRLARRRIGTVALTDGALPLAVPAVYALHGSDVLITADPTSVLGRRLPDSIVSLCVHDVADDLSRGWNITIVGHATRVDDPAVLDALPLARLPSWGQAWDEARQRSVPSPDGPRTVVARLGTDRMTGREVPGGRRGS